MPGAVSRRNAAVVLGLFVAVALAVYAPALDGGFLWDDDAHVTKPELRTAAGLARIWTDPTATQQYYPLTHSVFWLQSRGFGEDPIGYHVVNVVLHALSAWLAWLILSRLSVPGALLSATVFLVHPVNVESVAWITELKNSLSGVFYLAAALAYLEFAPPERAPDGSRSRSLYALACALFLCALLSKTVTATLPAALLLVTWWKRGSISWRRDVVPLAPLLAAGVVMGIVTAWIEKAVIGARGADYAFSAIERVLIAGRVFWFYLGKLLWPADLIFIYPRFTIDAGAAWQYLYPLGALALVIAAWAFRGRIGRGPVTGLLYFGGTLFPVLGFVDVYPFKFSFVADHFQYLASLGVIVLVGAGIALGSRRLGGRLATAARPAGVVVGVCWVVVLGASSWRRCHVYESAETLWVDTTRRSPGSFMAHNNLGFEYSRQGRYAEAQRSYEAAIAAKPDFDQAHFNLGRLHGKLGRPELAIEMYRAALAVRPDFAEASYNLGIELGTLGRNGEAIAAFKRALEAQPDFAEAHFNLGVAHHANGESRVALEDYRAAIELRPDYAEAHAALGVVYAELGEHDNAAAALLAAGSLFGQRRQYVEALDALRGALVERPDHAEAYFKMGVAYARLGRNADAVAAWEAAARLDPLGSFGCRPRSCASRSLNRGSAIMGR
jgi:Tfp pilus assembly protein PilF